MVLEDFQQKYQAWRDEKLARFAKKPNPTVVEIGNPFALSSKEKNAIARDCQDGNLSLIYFDPKGFDNRQANISINKQMGLIDIDQHRCVEDDGIVVIEDSESNNKGAYVPYSNKALNWHTDGYYNEMCSLVGAFSLYCVEAAAEGGENSWIDPEMLYIHLMELNPDLVEALSQPNALTIPEQKEEAVITRPASVGPVFFIDRHSHTPKMRFTQRKKNVVWQNSKDLTDALTVLNNFLATPSEIHHEVRLSSGMGLICNNVVHNRAAFKDGSQHKRQLLRGRYKNNVCLPN